MFADMIEWKEAQKLVTSQASWPTNRSAASQCVWVSDFSCGVTSLHKCLCMPLRQGTFLHSTRAILCALYREIVFWSCMVVGMVVENKRIRGFSILVRNFAILSTLSAIQPSFAETLSWRLLETFGGCGARHFQSAEVIGDYMVVFGGYDGQTWRQDLWVLNLSECFDQAD